MNCDGKKEIDGVKCPVCDGNGFLKLNIEKKWKNGYIFLSKGFFKLPSVIFNDDILGK